VSNAIRIDASGGATGIDLPEDGGPELNRALRALLGGTPERAAYHPASLLWVHGDGQSHGLAPNLIAWTLASAWRGMPLPYQLYGTVIVTGRDHDGESTPLEDNLASHVHTVAETVAQTMADWRRRPPVSTDAAIGALVTYAIRDVTA
jgi:hypothetical protein